MTTDEAFFAKPVLLSDVTLKSFRVSSIMTTDGRRVRPESGSGIQNAVDFSRVVAFSEK